MILQIQLVHAPFLVIYAAITGLMLGIGAWLYRRAAGSFLQIFYSAAAASISYFVVHIYIELTRDTENILLIFSLFLFFINSLLATAFGMLFPRIVSHVVGSSHLSGVAS